jgi:hypothetical protein
LDDLIHIRQHLVSQVAQRAKALSNGHDTAAEGHIKPATLLQSVTTFRELDSLREPLNRAQQSSEPPLPPHGRSRKDIDGELAAAARSTPNHVRTVRRLIRSGHEDLIAAVMLRVLPVGTALRAASPKGVRAERQRFIEVLS